MALICTLHFRSTVRGACRSVENVQSALLGDQGLEAPWKEVGVPRLGKAAWVPASARGNWYSQQAWGSHQSQLW